MEWAFSFIGILDTLGSMGETDWSKVLGWPGYRVYRHEINEQAKTLKLWVRRKRGNRKLICSGCGRKLSDAYNSDEREVRDLPCFEFRTTVVIELYRVRCPDCGVKMEKVPQSPSKAPFSKRFEEAVGLACESAAVRRVARLNRHYIAGMGEPSFKTPAELQSVLGARLRKLRLSRNIGQRVALLPLSSARNQRTV